MRREIGQVFPISTLCDTLILDSTVTSNQVACQTLSKHCRESSSRHRLSTALRVIQSKSIPEYYVLTINTAPT